MAVCPSCGSEVSDSSNFCTSCGHPMPKAQPVPVAASRGASCPSCGKAVAGSSAFCTGCGQKLPIATGAAAASTEPAAVAERAAAPAPAVAPKPAAQVSPLCISCGNKIEPGVQFCTGCGAPLAAAISATPPAAIPAATSVDPAATKVVSIDRAQEAKQPSNVSGAEGATPAEASGVIAAPEVVASQPAIEPAPESVPRFAPAQPEYLPTQPPSRGKFGLVVFILLIVIVGAALGGWYFWGVETIVVCSPPDVTVFLDDQQVASTSYGRYVIPHLSRKTHFLKVEKPGFADTIERLDFPLSSSREWVNIRLVPSRQIRP